MEKLLEKNFSAFEHLLIFLGKILIEQGVFPEREHCALSGSALGPEVKMVLVAEQGGFVASHCVNVEEQRLWGDGSAGQELWRHLGVIGHTKYSELTGLNLQHPVIVNLLFQYLCYQFQFEKNEFKSLSMVL